MAPQTMGTSIATLAGIYLRWRIVKAIFTYVPVVGQNAVGMIHMGVADDNGAEGGSTPVPINAYEVANLRCAVISSVTESAEFEWKPLDPDRWFYSYGTGTSSDQRWVVPGTFYVQNDGQSSTLIVHARFHLEFSGEAGDGSQ